MVYEWDTCLIINFIEIMTKYVSIEIRYTVNNYNPIYL